MLLEHSAPSLEDGNSAGGMIDYGGFGKMSVGEGKSTGFGVGARFGVRRRCGGMAGDLRFRAVGDSIRRGLHSRWWSVWVK